MMDTTETLIASLAQTPAPVTVSAQPFALCMKWFSGSLAYTAFVLIFMGLRPDLGVKIHSPLFAAELMVLVCVILSASISAMVLSFPDLFQKRWLAFTPIIAVAAFAAILFVEWLHTPPAVVKPPHGAECLVCITFLSLLPSAWMLTMLRKQASVHYYWSGAVALIAACGIGCLALRLSEQTDSIMHLLQWHYLPMIGFGALGVWLGRTFLKW